MRRASLCSKAAKIGAVLFLASASVEAGRAQSAEQFASPAIDRSVFKEGEVRRLRGEFKEWEAVCDEIPRLKQRFCSLFGQGKDKDGRTQLSIVVTTSDDGVPAAMLRLPLAVIRQQGVEVSAAPVVAANKGDKAKRPEAPVRLRIVDCDSVACTTVLRLTPGFVAALSSGGGLGVRFALPRQEAAAPGGASVPQAIDATISGSGFAEAITATLEREKK